LKNEPGTTERTWNVLRRHNITAMEHADENRSLLEDNVKRYPWYTRWMSSHWTKRLDVRRKSSFIFRRNVSTIEESGTAYSRRLVAMDMLGVFHGCMCEGYPDLKSVDSK